MPLIASDEGAKVPLMMIFSDPRFPDGSNGTFQVRSPTPRDGWRSYTEKTFAPPYIIETSLRMEKAEAPGAEVLFRIPGHGEFLVGLNYLGHGRVRVGNRFFNANWKIGEWVPIRIRVEPNEIKLIYGEESFSCTPSKPIKKDHVWISVYCAAGSWKPIRIADLSGQVLFEEKWDGTQHEQWRNPGVNLLRDLDTWGVGVTQIHLEHKRALRADGTFDFSSFDRYCREALTIAPQTWIVARTWVDSGRAVRQETYTAKGSKVKHFPWSYSDPEELIRQKSFLKAFLVHAENQPYAKAFAGFLLMSGNGGEFVYHFDTNRFSDYSSTHRSAFQRELRKKYQTIGKLNQAWKSSWKSFSEIPVPTVAERMAGENRQVLLQDGADQFLIDYQMFHNETVARWISELTKTIKENSRIPRLVGAYYGYSAVATGSIFNKGHNALALLLESDIDFLSCPYQYRNRTAGNPILFQLPSRSVNLHGKAVFLEDDTRTCFRPNSSDPFREKNLADSRATLKRNFLQAFAANCGMWYLDFGGDWFSQPELKDVIETISSCYEARRHGKLNSSPCQAVALISEKAFCRMRYSPKSVTEPVFHQLVDVLASCGTSFDVALLSDLEKLPSYRFYFVLNLPAAPKEEREAVSHLQKKVGDRLYAPENFECVPLETIRKKLRSAGVEFVCESPVAVYQGENWLGIHTLQAEEALTVRFPKDVRSVQELFTGKKWEVIDQRLTLRVQKGETYLWCW